MQPVVERFLKYIAIDTTSCENAKCYPSTTAQLKLANLLAEELKAAGLVSVRVDEYGYVFGTVPATKPGLPVLGLISHMDTSPAASGANIHPQFVDYQGGDLVLNEAQNIVMRTGEFDYLDTFKGQTLITTDGTTLLGADDKAGIAEIIETAHYLITHPELPHGEVRIAFTPDEEVGTGTAYFSVKDFGADIAYTVDGGMLGEIEYENFNSATAQVDLSGISIHTGAAKNKMRNALLCACEYQSMLPPAEIPACTEGREGFYHLRLIEGGVEHCKMVYNIREHDNQKFARRKETMQQIADYLNSKYGPGTVQLTVHDTCGNMKDMLADHMELIELAKAAFVSCGIEPTTPPIRGGTDGARLSFLGLPCPNLSTGGMNFHGRYEFIPVQAMEQMVRVLTKIITSFAETNGEK